MIIVPFDVRGGVTIRIIPKYRGLNGIENMGSCITVWLRARIGGRFASI